MEIRSIGSAPAQPTTTSQKAAAETGAAPARRAPERDTVTLSRDAVAALEQRREQLMQQLHARQQQQTEEMLRARQKRQEKENAEIRGDPGRVQHLCAMIAARITRGDRVPPQDEQYLLEHDSNGYKLAMALRRFKRDPEEYDSLLTDKDKKKEKATVGEMPDASGTGTAADILRSAAQTASAGDA